MISVRTFIKTSLALLAAAAAASAVAQDWPGYQGLNNRTGTNGDVVGSGPGWGKLRWFYPNSNPGEGKPSSYVRNNTSDQATWFGGWAPSTTNIQAGDPFTPLYTTDKHEGSEQSYFDIPSGTVIDPPAYRYIGEIASESRITGQSYDPRVPAVGTASTFTWTIDTTDTTYYADGATPRNYSLYVWVPQGPTGPSGNPLVPYLYPQRYCVYDIQYGNGQHYVDTVDTWQAGWIRLGNGGQPTSRTFAYNGVNPISITLYNTVPRDATGQLTDQDPANPGQVNPIGVVYADAVLAVPDYGSYVASPTVRLNPNVPIASTQTRVTGVFNRFVTDNNSGTSSQVGSGEISSYNYATGQRIWRFTLKNLNAVSVTVDNADATTAPAGAWTSATGPAVYNGTDYYRAALQNTSLAAAASVTYQPVMADGSYQVQIYLAGTTAPADNPGQGTVLKVFEGAVETDVTVNQRQGPGWYTVGTRNFNHDAVAAPLKVAITNYSGVANDTLLGRVAYADEVRFVQQVVPAVNSTPVQTTAMVRYDPNNPTIVPATPMAVDVTIVAAEDGRIYCLDTKGNGDGTTNLIWAYPSLPVSYRPDPALNIAGDPPIDPNTDVATGQPIANQLDGENGNMIAQMPTSFSTSSALVRQNAAGEDLLYIGASNGRVYCIEMAGRGDENIAGGIPGTTKRRWTFPDDYPSIQKPALGAFSGSVAFATTTQGPTIFAPDSQGRMYAVDADGSATTRTTTTRWTFPSLTTPTLGAIKTTPVIAFNPQRIYFATTTNGSDPGAIWCLDAANPTNAALQWSMNGLILADGTTRYFDDFLSSPTIATAAELGGGLPDTVYFANMNSYVVGISSTGTVQWYSNELGNGVRAPLSLSYMTVYDNAAAGLPIVKPVVLVPTADNIYGGLFADSYLNFYGTKLAWGYQGEGGNQTSGLSVGRNWMYTGDGAGDFFAFNNIGGSGNYLTPGNPPGAEILVPDNPQGAEFRNIKIKVLTKVGARHLLQKDTLSTVGVPAGNYSTDLTYDNIDNDPGNVYTKAPRADNQLAFEWGERAQLVMYNFPYKIGSTGTPPRVQYVITVDGKDGRTRIADSRQFKAATVTDPGTGDLLDAYCVIDLPIQGIGPDGVPPGPGRVTFSIRANVTGSAEQVIGLNPNQNHRDFYVANPVGIGTPPQGTAVTSNPSSIGLSYEMGASTDPYDLRNKFNGSYDITGFLGSKLAVTPGMINHGGSGKARVYVWDRSLMTELRGPGHGLDQIVRVQPDDLAWLNGAIPYRRFIDLPATAIFANFEDQPTQFPNISLDYPNIHRDRFEVTKDPNGTPENPIFGGVSLTPPSVPTDVNGEYTNEQNRVMVALPFDFQIDVPKYQPPAINNAAGPVTFPTFLDSANNPLVSGYTAHLDVFVDSNGNSRYDTANGSREAMRSLTYSMNVAPDQKLVVTSPTVDLGSLTEGTGFAPDFPGSATSSYNPRNPNWTGLFQSFTVTNEGNVNLLNVRLAKGTNSPSGINPWALFGSITDDLAYLNGYSYLLSDIDRDATSQTGTFKLTQNSIIQKPRVGDTTGTSLSTNPEARVNLNNNITVPTPFLNPAQFPVQPPRVTVAVPLGFPVGSYENLVGVIEDMDDDQLLAIDNNFKSLEPISSPMLDLKFKVTETQVTTTMSKQRQTSTVNPQYPMGAPLVDNLATGGNFSYSNVQPAGIRMADGTLLLAWSSNRADPGTGNPTDTPGQATNASANDQMRVYVAALHGQNTGAVGGFTPTRDLDAWQSNGAQWFSKSASTANGFPQVTPALFNTQGGENLLTETAKFGLPALPIQGQYQSGPSNIVFMAFEGSAQKGTAAGRVLENRLFVAPVTVANGVATVGQPISMPYDISSAKGRPSIIQRGSTAVIFYSSITTSGGQVMFTTLDWSNAGTPVWTQPVAVSLPAGIESQDAPSVVARPYTDTLAPLLDANGVAYSDVLDISFTGRIRGRSSSEVFFTRLATRQTVGTIFPAPIGAVYLPATTRESLTADAGSGVYRSLGLGWNPQASISTGLATHPEVVLEQNTDGVVTDLEVPGTRIVDISNGVISFSCTLGGKVYLDPNLGTIRFTSATPGRHGLLYLSYQPLVQRVSLNTTSSYTGSTILFDHRLVSLSVNANDLRGGLYGPDYWGRSNGNQAQRGDTIRNDRYIVMYNRGSAGGGQTARPYMKTLRYGVQLPTAVATRADGSIVNLVVTGLQNGEFYQVDPAKGRVYFEATTEARPITVTYTGAAADGSFLAPRNDPYSVSLITESQESIVPIENATNESSIAPFLDPYDSVSALASNNRRPGLVWMFWSSTRGGNSDIFMETIAPRFNPVASGH